MQQRRLWCKYDSLSRTSQAQAKIDVIVLHAEIVFIKTADFVKCGFRYQHARSCDRRNITCRMSEKVKANYVFGKAVKYVISQAAMRSHDDAGVLNGVIRV